MQFLIYFAIILIIVAIALILLMPTPENQHPGKANTLDDFQFPDNSQSRPIPKIYGTVFASGNIIYIGNLRTKTITHCQ